MKWVNLQHNFNIPAKSFYVAFRDLHGENELSEVPSGLSTAEAAAEFADRLLKKYRPELADSAVLVGMDVSLLKRCLELVYVHKSFPEVLAGDLPQSEPLIPNSWIKPSDLVADEAKTICHGG